ncbi:hypothetical protein AVEN_125603-1, partial [Araneus ventricosus]
MFQAIGSVALSWVKAQAGIPGNELTDQYAKIATTDGQELNVSSPYSYLKRKIKNYIAGRDIGRTLTSVLDLK